jgi:type II secretory pathway component GspD/PulD (secretin)
MTRRILFAALLAASLAAAAAPARAQEGIGSATSRPERPGFAAWARGRDAERAGNPEEAFAAYSQALRDAPTDPEYRALVERTRFALAESFSNQAERAMLADNPVEAATLLRRALSYDPQNDVATDRLRQLERHAVQESPATPEFAAAPPQLVPQPGNHDFNYRGPARGAYQELARQFGLTVIFDDDVTNPQIRFQVSAVDFQTAAVLLSTQTGTFLRALDSRTFLVVNDTQQKRREYLPQIERTILLPESEKPEQMNEIVRAVRDVAGLTHTQFDTRSRTLTVRGSERDVALASALISQLEQPRGEVMLEIDVIEVDRNSAETLGIVPPSSAQTITLSKQQLQIAEQSTNGLVQIIQELFGTPAAFAGSSTQQISSLLGSGTTSLSALVPPLIAFGGGQTIFLATLPGATANFANQLSVVLNAQRILLRAEDGEPASFFVGERFPINFATLSNEFATAGATPGITEGTLATGTSPRGVATAVLRTTSTVSPIPLDVITANHDAGTVSVLLGNGNGSFQNNVDYAAGANPVAVAAAAFCSTSSAATACTSRPAGTLDLAVVDQGTNNVQILLGNGDGTFRAPVAYAVGRQPSGLVLGDFNGDGITDIAVTNTADDTVSVLLGKGDGTFLPGTVVPLVNGKGPVGIVAADFGTPAVQATPAVSCPAGQTIRSIARSGGTVTATLSSALTVPGGNTVGTVLVAGVGDPSFDGPFVVLSGSGTTTLTWKQPGANASSSGGSANVGSMPAIVSISRSNGTVTATLSFALSVPGGNGTGMVSVTNVTDPGFDGNFIVLTGSGTTTLTWAETGSNATSSGGTISVSPVLATITSISRASNTVTAMLSSALTTPGGNGFGLVQVAGVTDPSFDGTFVVLTGSGTATLTWMQTGSDATSGGGSATVSFPVGTKDLAVANSVSNTATVLFRFNNGNFCSQTDINTGTFPVAIATADFNDDTLPDLAVANETDGTVSVFLNGGTPSTATSPATALFNSRLDITVGNQPDALITGDFNNDSQQDMVVANSGDGTITALFGSGTGTFPANISLQTSAGITCSALPAPSVPCQGLASGDFNGDGLQDVAVTDPANNTVTIVINSQQLAVANAQLPYPGFQYEDIGVKAKATPHIHPSGDVTLILNVEIRSLSTVNLNGIPILTNRTLEQTVRLHPDEPSVVSGIFSDQQTLSLTGTPGAAEIPGLDYLLTNQNPQQQQTELVIVVTPRLVRFAPRTQQVFYAGRERQALTQTGIGGADREAPEAPLPEPGQPLVPGQPPAPPTVPPPGGQPPTRPRP